jgi:malonyl-CoA/methylmalonyl-CoA synthetase
VEYWFKELFIGLPHADFGEGVVAVIVAKNGPESMRRLLRAHSLENRESSKMPKRVLFIDELPGNAMGKVQKNTLREIYQKIVSGKP